MSNVENIKRILGVSNAYEWRSADGTFYVKWENGEWYFWQGEWVKYSVDANRLLNDWFKTTAPIAHWRACMRSLYKQGLRI